MLRLAKYLTVAAGMALIIGCPTAGNLAQGSSSGADSTGGSAATSGSGSSATDATTGSSGSVFGVTLQADFPDCAEVADEARVRQTLYDLVNQARAEAGYGPVKQNQTLEDQATQYACEMIQYDFFAHENPVTGSTLADRADEFGYRYLVIGENLAAGQPTVEKVFQDWMNSPGHRANILDSRFTELGIGIRRGGSLGMYWVQEFGRPFTDPFPRPSTTASVP